MNGRLNLYFANPALHQVQSLRDLVSDAIFLPSAPPFEREEVCATVTLPLGARLFSLSSHTHQRGERFTVHHPDGTLLYENTIFNDPLRQSFDPPFLFDAPDDVPAALAKYFGWGERNKGAKGVLDALAARLGVKKSEAALKLRAAGAATAVNSAKPKAYEVWVYKHPEWPAPFANAPLPALTIRTEAEVKARRAGPRAGPHSRSCARLPSRLPRSSPRLS